jgi:hypothetical protein
MHILPNGSAQIISEGEVEANRKFEGLVLERPEEFQGGLMWERLQRVAEVLQYHEVPVEGWVLPNLIRIRSPRLSAEKV